MLVSITILKLGGDTMKRINLTINAENKSEAIFALEFMLNMIKSNDYSERDRVVEELAFDDNY